MILGNSRQELSRLVENSGGNMPNVRLAGPLVLLMKLGPVLVKMLKFLKIGKVGLAATSVASYAYLFSWQFALVIVAAVFVHEYGHLSAMKYFKMKTKGIYMIPFVGGAAVAKEGFPSRRAEAIIAIAGPLVGALSAVVCGLIYLASDNVFFAAIASWVAFINLFNLLPIVPLDGGKILGSITFSIKNWLGLGGMVVGMLLAAVMAFVVGSSIFVIITIIGTIELLVEWKGARERSATLPIMSARGVVLTFMAYVGLAVFLCGLMAYMGHVPSVGLAMQILRG
jgi:Zn-dependent protease